MDETRTRTGSCHCGKVRFELKTDLSRVFSCNCSICSRAGYLLAFVPEDQFTLLGGEDALTDYQFHKKNVHHTFCSTCGIRAFGRGTGRGGEPVRFVNVRCLDDVDVASLEITQVDGKSR
jgi:hypothetical protein